MEKIPLSSADFQCTQLNKYLNEVLEMQIDQKIKEDVFKVVESLKFIKVNLDYISWAVNYQKKAPRKVFLNERDRRNGVIRDFEGTSLHINFFKTGKEARDSLSTLVESFEHAIERMRSLNKLVPFTQKIEYDRLTGCIEKRTAAALSFVTEAETLNLDHLFQQCCNLYPFDNRPAFDNYRDTFHFFTPYMEQECVYNNQTETITKELIISYLQMLGQDLEDEELPAEREPEPLDVVCDRLSQNAQIQIGDNKDKQVQFIFTNQQESEEFVSWLKKQVTLAPLNIEELRCNVSPSQQHIVCLTSLQYNAIYQDHAYELLLVDSSFQAKTFINLLGKASQKAIDKALLRIDNNGLNLLQVAAGYQGKKAFIELVEKASKNAIDKAIVNKYKLNALQIAAFYQDEISFLRLAEKTGDKALNEALNPHTLRMICSQQSSNILLYLLQRINEMSVLASFIKDTAHCESLLVAIVSLLMDEKAWGIKSEALEKISKAAAPWTSQIIELMLTHYINGQTFPKSSDAVASLSMLIKTQRAGSITKALLIALGKADDLTLTPAETASFANDNPEHIFLADGDKIDLTSPDLEARLLKDGVASWKDVQKLNQHQPELSEIIDFLLQNQLQGTKLVNNFHVLRSDAGNHAIDLFKTGQVLIKVFTNKEHLLEHLDSLQIPGEKRIAELRRAVKYGATHKFFHKTAKIKEHRPQYKKRKQSQKTSATLISQHLHTKLFGELSKRTLVGIAWRANPTEDKAWLRKDRGTWNHEWISKKRKVKQYAAMMEGINYTNYNDFKEAIDTDFNSTNEVLSHLRKENMLAIVIGRDTPAARKIAKGYVQKIQNEFQITLPIVFYNSAHCFVREYTVRNQIGDQLNKKKPYSIAIEKKIQEIYAQSHTNDKQLLNNSEQNLQDKKHLTAWVKEAKHSQLQPKCFKEGKVFPEKRILIEDFLTSIRQGIVESVAYQHSAAKYRHKIFFNHAQLLGFGVIPTNSSEVSSAKKLVNSRELNALTTAIKEHYTAWSILNDLLFNIEAELRDFYHYGGNTPEGYNEGTCDDILVFFKTMFSDESFDEADIFLRNESGELFDINWHTIQIKLWETLKNDGYIHFEPEEIRFYEKLFSKHEKEFKEEEAYIKENRLYRYPYLIKYVTPYQPGIISLIFDSIELIKDVELFFKLLTSFNDFEEDLNKRADFYQAKIQGWLTIADNETRLINSIDTPLLFKHIEQIPFLCFPESTLKRILTTFRTLDDDNVLMLMAKYQTQALDILANDDLTIKEKVLAANILMSADKNLPALLDRVANCDLTIQKEVLAIKNCYGDNALMLAIKYHPQSLKPLLDMLVNCDLTIQKEVLTIKNCYGDNALMLAIKYHPQSLKPLLDMLINCDLTIKEKVLAANNMLMLAIKHQPQALEPLLDILANCDKDIQEEVFAANYYGEHILMLAIEHQPQALEPLLDILANCDKNIQGQVMATKKRYGHDNILLLAVENQLPALVPLLGVLANCDMTTQREVLTTKGWEGCNALMLAAKAQPKALKPLFDILINCDLTTRREVLSAKDYQGNNALMLAAANHPQELGALLKEEFPYFAILDTYTKKQILSGQYPFNKIPCETRAQLTITINTQWDNNSSETLKIIKQFYKETKGVNNSLKKFLIMDAISTLPEQNLEEFKKAIFDPNSKLNRALNFKRNIFSPQCFFNIPSNTLTACQKYFDNPESSYTQGY